jgi:hypothetical protein
MSSSDTIVGYNKNDFFYVNAENAGISLTPEICSLLNVNSPTWDISCNDAFFFDNSANCMKKELCINKEQAAKLKSLQQNHSGADEKYDNSKQVYDQTFAHTINLGGGILALLLIMYKITLN